MTVLQEVDSPHGHSKVIILVGTLTKVSFQPKYSFRAIARRLGQRLSRIEPGAIIRGVFRHPHAEDSSSTF
jgi:hypothetical protein